MFFIYYIVFFYTVLNIILHLKFPNWNYVTKSLYILLKTKKHSIKWTAIFLHVQPLVDLSVFS